MKIKYFAAVCPDPVAVRFDGNLLCTNLPSPLEPSFDTGFCKLKRLWRQSQFHWANESSQDALAVLMHSLNSSGIDRRHCISTLFLAAHLHFHRNDAIQANRCIQSAVRMHAEDTGLIANESSTIAATNSPLGAREWLILGLSSLLKNDMPSCLMWIQQAERDLESRCSGVPSKQRLQLHGDLHAVVACVAAKSNETDEAEKALAIAYRAHVQAESVQSATRDLILTARLAVQQNETARAVSLLDAAECQLTLALSPCEFHRCQLVAVIHRDRANLQSTDPRIAESRWN